MLRVDSPDRATSLRPAATINPNMITAAPPSTGSGIAPMTAASFGMKPQISRKTAPTVTTCRLMTRVKETRPTFWL